VRTLKPRIFLRVTWLLLAACITCIASAQPVSVDLIDLNNALAIKANVAGRDALLLVDTGSYELRLRKSFAEKLSLKLRTVGNDALGLVPVKIGGVTDASVRTLVQDLPLPFEGDRSKPGVEGIIGLTFLQRHAVGLDLANYRLTLWEGGKLEDRQVAAWFGGVAPASAGLKGTPREGAWYRLRSDIDGKALELVVDTGTSWTTVAPRHAKGMRLRRVGSVASYTFAGRSSVQACVAEKVNLGSLSLLDQIVAIDSADEEYDGLLGLHSLRNCKVLLDFPSQKAYLSRVGTFVSRPNGSALVAVGIDLMRLADDRLMAMVVPSSPAEKAGVRSGDILLSVNGRPAEELLAMLNDQAKQDTTAAWGEALMRKTYALIVRRTDGTTKRLSIKRA
jgi:predicted aspartyl protease